MRGKQSCQIYVVRYYSQTDLLASLLILYDAVKAVCATSSATQRREAELELAFTVHHFQATN